MKNKKNKDISTSTLEEIKEKAWESYKNLPKNNSFGSPTYEFQKGDSIRVGNLKNCIADDIKIDNGLTLYGFTFTDKDNKKGYRYTPWYNARPICKDNNKTSFTKEDDINIHFSPTSLESLLNKFYLHGVDMTPEYQRDYVWEDKDKEALLDSIFNHIEIGKFAFIKKDYRSDYLYEILDGKQRLSTLLDFYENRLPYKGVYFNELSFKDRYTFLNTSVVIGETEELTKDEIYKYFYTLNKCGKTMDETHLNKIKALMDEEKGKEFIMDKSIVFTSGEEMYAYLKAGNDLYNPNTEEYVFVYNDADALAIYKLNRREIENFDFTDDGLDDSWSAYLGVGGYILDSPEYEKYKYSENEKERCLYLKPSIDYCKNHFSKEGWINTKDYEKIIANKDNNNKLEEIEEDNIER